MIDIDMIGSLDINNPTIVEVLIRDDGTVVWVNIDGLCRLRVCRIKKLTVDDRRPKVTKKEK
jgi:hypothetical protein